MDYTRACQGVLEATNAACQGVLTVVAEIAKAALGGIIDVLSAEFDLELGALQNELSVSLTVKFFDKYEETVDLTIVSLLTGQQPL